mmetsp:Transcript_91797/g.259194  ORF Transcript_91797/g.259194 Transcript_91797/m.259194 type:complete len:1206 (+) Transcript_91797:117-3734(+)
MASSSVTSAGSQSGSRTKPRSGQSVTSTLSNLSRRGLSFSFRSTTRSSMRSEDEVWNAGDQCETVSLVTVRREEALESECLTELPIGTTCEVLQVGEGRRVKVQAGDVSGWISSRTKMNEALIVKRKLDVQFAIEDFEVGGQHEVKSMVTVRVAEALDSEVKTELRPGAIVKIIELGVSNKRRAKISTDDMEGWISMATKQGELLIGKVTEHRGERSGLFGASSSKIKIILEAARSGDLEAIVKIVEGKASMMSRFSSRPNLNCSDIRGKTPLIYAAAFGNKEVVEYLLSKTEVDINAMDDTQKSAMHHALKRARRRREITYDMVQAEIVDMLIRAKGYLEARDHNGCTALMFAVANGDETVMQTLLLANANVNVKDFEGHTPLDYATNFGHTSLVKILRAAGAKGDDSDDEFPYPYPMPYELEPLVVNAVLPDHPQANEYSDRSIASSIPPMSRTSDCGDVSDRSGVSTSASATKSKKPIPGKAKAKSKEQGDAVSPKKAPKAKAKGKAKGKAVKALKVRALPTAMQEMLEDNENDTKVEKQEMIIEDVEPSIDEAEQVKELARQKLLAALTTTSIKELQVAIDAAAQASVTQDDIDNAQKVLQGLKARAAARDDLLNAVGTLDITMLKAAISQAAKCGVSGDEIREARQALAEEEPKAEVRKKLTSAAEAGSTDSLQSAIEEAKALKIPDSELKHYLELLEGAESKEKALALLEEARKCRDVPKLKYAIQQAKDCGIDTTSAEAVLREEEPKQKAREQLAEAIESCTIAALQQAIQVAKEACLGEEEYAEALAVIKHEEEKERLLAEVKATMEKSKAVDMTDIEKMKAIKEELSEVILIAKNAGVMESLLADAELRRRKIHNGIEDLKGSIRVFCRVRPLSKKEIDQGDAEVTKQIDPMTLQVEDHKFSFDAVFVPGTQDEVFEDCRDLVQSAVDGYNVTMFAYGQTGAGKTFTMYGAPGMEGTAPRTIQEIYRVLELGKERYTYTIMGSMLELYRNDLIDLLAKGNKGAGAAQGKLNVRQDKNGMVQVEHLTEEECHHATELSDLLDRGNAQRTVAATAMNSQSSRSHLVLMIKIISVNKQTKDQLRGKILICDLAGSERLKKSQVTAEMQKEAIEINKSLTALGDVIESLTKGSKQIPYRNHKLTQLMQDSLGGTAKTLMFVNCSPANSNTDETLMSLKYATRAKQIKNTVKKAKKEIAHE